MPERERMTVDGNVLTPRMQRTLSTAARLARRYGHDYIGTEHVLLAFLNDDGGIAGSMIRSMADGDLMEDRVTAILETPSESPGDKPAETTDEP
jgi:ATP-dependent Clp protease ATP-binding subunit ClpA